VTANLFKGLLMKCLRSVLVCVCICITGGSVSLGQESGSDEMLYEQIKNLSYDENEVAEVESLILKRDVATFYLNHGKIHLAESFEGKIIGAVFSGEGIFEFSPPLEIERHQLKRFTDRDSLREEFDELCLLFTDSTAEELMNKLNFARKDPSRNAKSMGKDRVEQCLHETGFNLWTRLLADVLADSLQEGGDPVNRAGFFYADVKTRDLGRLFFTFDPKVVEEVLLEKPDPRPGIHLRDDVCSFHRMEDYLKNPDDKYLPIPGEDKDEIKVIHYKMDVKIDFNEKIFANVEMEFECLKNGLRVIDFDMHRNKYLEMERVTGDEDDSLFFVRDKEDQTGVSVFLSRPTISGESRRLTFKYSAKEVIWQDSQGDLYIRTATFWYPRYGYQKRATYDLTFRSPKGYEFVSIGKKKKEWVEGDFLCTHWVEESPVVMASFNYGNYETYESKIPGMPPVTVYHLEQSHRETGAKYKNIKENVAADMVNSLNFFQEMFGSYPFCKLAATEIASSGGQGLPGLLRLSWNTFLGDDGVQEWKLWDESFRAHEVSHQWWGHVVGWETYHDEWLCEGFAEYCGVWYAQLSMKNNEEFFEELERWRKDILGEGYKWSEGSKVGPIWLGRRLNSSQSVDYGSLVYEKGAYILHMLRNMMMDFENKSDDKFKAMLSDFAETYRGKNPSTWDFKAMVEKHVGENMDWFFEQWVYGTEIPKYVFSYSTQQVADKYEITCKITQENVPEDFKMWVPVLVDFGRDMYAVLRLWVDKPQNQFKLPRAPLEPSKVVLNPFHAVLCEVKNK
jgi:hypothetical protein